LEPAPASVETGLGAPDFEAKPVDLDELEPVLIKDWVLLDLYDLFYLRSYILMALAQFNYKT
jgi:hypothetical protein